MTVDPKDILADRVHRLRWLAERSGDTRLRSTLLLLADSYDRILRVNRVVEERAVSPEAAAPPAPSPVD